MMKNFYFLNFNEQFIKNDITIDNTRPDVWQTIKVSPNDYITDAGKKFLRSIKIFAYPEINLFVGPEQGETDIHVDVPYHSDPHSYAINYVWGPESKMKWYKALTAGRMNRTTANQIFYSFPEDEVELIEDLDVPVHRLMLVRIDIPHKVENFGNHRRYCLSVRSMPRLSWEEIVKYLRPHIVEEG